MSLGNRIKMLRNELGYTQDDLAKRLDVSVGAVSSYERDYRFPMSDILQKMTDIFGVSYDYLLGRSKKRNAEDESEKYEVPVFYVVACGNPFVADEDIVDWEEIDPKLKSQGEHFGVKLRGDSMLPDFKNGDLVIVRK